MHSTATALAHPNIALIKYWGNRDAALRIPVNGSISMCLSGLETVTRVEFQPDLLQDQLYLDSSPAEAAALRRVSKFLDQIRLLAGLSLHARVDSSNNFPAGAGIASSASAFAALALAGTRAAGLELSEKELSRLARLGSGSASRSVPPGFVEWLPGESDLDSYAVSLAAAEHWPLCDVIAVVSAAAKKIGSTEGHQLAPTSPLQAARVMDAPRRLDICRQAILRRDFEPFAQIVEHDSNLMHAVMMTSQPPLFYWQPASLNLMQRIMQWRASGLPVCYTLDAGPNVHILCEQDAVERVKAELAGIPGVERILLAQAGPGASLLN